MIAISNKLCLYKFEKDRIILKIGKLTLDGYFNYGNVLQNYALRQVLLRYAKVVDSFWHEQDNFIVKTWFNWSWKKPLKWLIKYQGFRKEIKWVLFECVRQGKIKEWCDRYISSKRVTDLFEVADKYDFFVVGSDQVWNPHLSDLRHCFLYFAENEKRIAYAASISCPDIPADKIQMYKKGFAGMAHISMREQQGADIVKELSGRDVPVVVDPTLLLDADDWRMVSRQPAWYHGGDYILTYFLGRRPKVVSRLEGETGLKVVNLLDKDVYEHYVTGPDEFLWAIEHAKLVYTDSFHGTVFSILFRTPFVVCDRVGDDVSEKMGSRIDTLLGYFGLEARRGTKANGYAIENLMAPVNWSKVDMVLARERARADKYLRKALGIV